MQGTAEGKIIIPELPSSINYSDAVTILTQAGFTNVTSEPISKSQGLEHYLDKFGNWLNGKKDGEVVEVSVNGKTDYDSETYIPKDAIIVVRYYQKESK